MKIILFTLLICSQAFATFLPECAPGMMQVWTQTTGSSCVPKLTPAVQDPLCPPWQIGIANPFASFPGPLFQNPDLPWWALQGNLYYPNVSYPGPWQYPGIQSQYYPGEGQVVAAKPNVYINSIYDEKKFSFKFSSPDKPQFLATTPILD
jgi:hypothetical protein